MTREIFRHRNTPLRVVCLTKPHLLLPLGHDPYDTPVRCLYRIDRLHWFRWKPVRSPYHHCRREAVRRCRALADYEVQAGLLRLGAKLRLEQVTKHIDAGAHLGDASQGLGVERGGRGA